jgi:hypothetical protein
MDEYLRDPDYAQTRDLGLRTVPVIDGLTVPSNGCRPVFRLRFWSLNARHGYGTGDTRLNPSGDGR